MELHLYASALLPEFRKQAKEGKLGSKDIVFKMLTFRAKLVVFLVGEAMYFDAHGGYQNISCKFK
jgi:hypothetical protein